MYCPKCATHLADTATYCHGCDLDVQPIAAIVRGDNHVRVRAARVQRWKQQRRSLGMLIIMCSLLVGCFIPISVGLFSQFDWLASLITLLAGVAGVLLFGGSMLLMAADGTILSTDDMPSLPGNDNTFSATPLLAENRSMPGTRYDEAAQHLNNR